MNTMMEMQDVIFITTFACQCAAMLWVYFFAFRTDANGLTKMIKGIIVEQVDDVVSRIRP